MKQALMLVSLLLSFSASAWQAKVVGVIDGDTVTVRRVGDGQQIRIRLAEIDAPERTQAFGTAAKKHLSDLAFAKMIEVEDLGEDRYGRTIGLLSLTTGKDLNRQMLRDGFAWCYTRYAKRQSCSTDQQAAQAAKLGLWSDVAPLPPWQYRRQ